MKLWLTLMTQDREKDIEEMLKNTYDYFDGIVAVDHYSKDSTFNILNRYKKNGKIIQLPYLKHHAWSMNGFLFSGIIKNEDWFLIVDSSDRPRIEWLKNLRNDIENWVRQGVGGVYLDRIFLVRYNDNVEFVGGIHWGIQNIHGKHISLLTDNKKRDDFVVNTRISNRNVSGIEHPIKYFIEYPCSSQTQLLYQQFGNDVWSLREILRIRFRTYCQEYLGLQPTVEELINYFSDAIKNKTLHESIIDYIEDEVNLQDLIRYYILKQDLLGDIALNRFNWSFKKFYHKGIEHQDKNDGFIGIFNQYKIKKGENPE